MFSALPRITLSAGSLLLGLLAATPTVNAAAAANSPSAAAIPTTVKPLVWRDLVNRPERWPAQTRLTTEQRFRGEASLRAGTVVQIHAVKPNEVELIAPAGFLFAAAPGDCDLLAAANAQWARFTPEQRALTVSDLQRDMSLWPGRATLTVDQSFGSFTLKSGETYRVMRVSGGDVALWVPGRDGQQVVPLTATDVFVRARERVALPRDQRPGRMAEILDGLLVDAAGKSTPIGAADVYVQYLSASTCPRCAAFTPKFVEHYNAVLAGRDRVAFFGSSTDATMPPYFAYVKSTGMPWPTLPHQNKNVMIALGNLGVLEIPGIVVFDKFGQVLLSTNRIGGAPLAAAESALAQLDQKLPAGSAMARSQ